MRPRHELLAVAGAVAAVAALAAAGALAAGSRTVSLADPTGDVAGALDIQRTSLRLATDGRLRLVVTTAQKIVPSKLLSDSGPPGSICLKLWTDPTVDTTSTRPDRLVCVTARTKGALRATVLDQSMPGLPKSTGSAVLTLNKSARSVVLRIAQSSIGRPSLIRFAIESTRPGCVHVSCIDEVPDAGAVRRFRLHAT